MDIGKVALLGGGAWLVYHFLAGTQIVAPPPVATTPPAPGSTTPPASPASPTSPAVLDAIYQRVATAIGNEHSLTPDQFDYYLNAELAAIGKPAAPAPEVVFWRGLQP
jgi:hypothetical protein